MASPCAFQDAIKNFRSTAGLTQAELKDFSQTSLSELKRCIATIQNDQRASRKLRYLKRLGPFLETMERYGKIIEVFLNVSDVIAFVWVRLLIFCTLWLMIRGACKISTRGDEGMRRDIQHPSGRLPSHWRNNSPVSAVPNIVLRQRACTAGARIHLRRHLEFPQRSLAIFQKKWYVVTSPCTIK
jgi:hypothetical protein